MRGDAGDPLQAEQAAAAMIRQRLEPHPPRRRPVHLVRHFFGGMVALTMALRTRVPVASPVIEVPAATLLRERVVDAR